MIGIREPDAHRATRREMERKMAAIERGGARGAKPGSEFDLLGALWSAGGAPGVPTSDAEQRVFDLSAEARAVYNGRGNGQLQLPVEWLSRDLIAGTGTGGGYTVGTGARPPDSEIVEALRPVSLAATLGVPMWTGVTGWGPLRLPCTTSNAAASWVAENAAPSQASVTFDEITLTPATLTVNVNYSRRLRLTAAAHSDQFVRQHLLGAVMAEIDRAFLAGNGTGAEPTGLLFATGVTVEALGANGAAPALANFAAMEKAVGDANGRSIAFVGTPALRSKLRRTGDGFGRALWTENDRVAGMRGYVTSAMPSSLTKGTGTALSGAIAGDFSRALIAIFGPVDVLVDRVTSVHGSIKCVVSADVAIGVLQPSAFAVVKDAVTT